MAVDYTNYNWIGKTDVSNIKQLVEGLDESYWKKDTIRQDTYKAHKTTESLLLMWDLENLSTTTPSQKHQLFYDLEIQKFLDTIHPLYVEKYGDGYFNRVLLVKLKNNSEITPHVDGGMGLSEPRRTHIAVITNPDVIFVVGGEEKNMKEGEIWEIDNMVIHSVENLSDYDRIHFIIDYVIK